MRTMKTIRTWRDLQIAFFAQHPVSGEYTAPETRGGGASRVGTHTARLEYKGVRDDGCPCSTEFDIQSTRRNSACDGCRVSITVKMRPDCGVSETCSKREQCNSTQSVSIQYDGTRFMRAVRAEIQNWAGCGTVTHKKVPQRG